MRKFIIVFLVILKTSFYSFALVNQNICIIAKNPKDSVFEIWLENEIAKNTNINLFYSFKDENIDPMSFMFQNKLSGLLIIEGSNVTIYTPKGQLTNLIITPQNIESTSKLIISFFPPKEKEKIIKEIEEIDYISQLEEPKPKHFISVGLGINFSDLQIVESTSNNKLWYHENESSRNKFMPTVEYSFNTRYFYLSIGLGISENWKIDSKLGVWLLKGFMLIGIDTSVINLNYNLENFISYGNSQTSTLSKLNNKQVSLTIVNFMPLLKFKFSKNDILTITPFLTVPIIVKTENLTLQREDIEGGVKFLGINISTEFGLSENLSLGYSLKIISSPLNSTGYLNENNEIKFSLSAYSESVLFLKYKI